MTKRLAGIEPNRILGFRDGEETYHENDSSECGRGGHPRLWRGECLFTDDLRYTDDPQPKPAPAGLRREPCLPAVPVELLQYARLAKAGLSRKVQRLIRFPAD